MLAKSGPRVQPRARHAALAAALDGCQHPGVGRQVLKDPPVEEWAGSGFHVQVNGYWL
jgi:hypothetical protein